VAEKRLAELNARAEDPDLWNDPDAAQKVMRELKNKKRKK
jgi:peptide chain release factor 2